MNHENQDTKPAPFQVGDHVRYVADEQLALPAGLTNASELVLVPGMEGVVILSSGRFSQLGAGAPQPWQCRVQFPNGFQMDILPENLDQFEMIGAAAPNGQADLGRT